MTTAPLRLGLVGCGRLAERGYLPALAAVTDLELVAVADPDEGRRASVGSAVERYRSAAELLAGTPLDGVVIASPVGCHVADARAAAEAGVTALVEKPPAPDLATSAELLSLAPVPHLGFNRRFDVGAIAVRAAVPPEGVIELDLALRYRRPGWSAHVVADDALLDLGPHLIDWVRWITGREVRSVACPELSSERAVLDLELDDGRAHLDAATDRPHEERIELRVDGQPVARHRIGGTFASLRGRLRGGQPDALVTTLRGELVAFAHALRTGERGALGSPTDAWAVMSVIEAARTSATRDGVAVPVPMSPEVTR